ncbi:MAG: ATP-dependent helicase [Hyphomicrobiaceae bacterium]
MSNSALYLRAAEDLRENAEQWEAYNSEGHCVVLAGPGSGKTKTLTIKLARMLAEDVEEPRGLACITYNNECARELETRLATLGVEPGPRAFIGTVHSFSLTQVVLPYAKSARLGLPANFKVATQNERRTALERAHRRVVGGPGNPQDWDVRMGRYRRSILNRQTQQWRNEDPELARLVEEFESELRNMSLIDFDDMPLLAVKALRENEWLQRALLAKFPVLVVDEYQDLGAALHRMVLGLCFSTGMRLFAVGDVDQSIYGFTGAHPELLQQVSERADVQTVRLRFNYRCGSRIVTASEYALGEERGYQAPEGASLGAIYFHPRHQGDFGQQADYLFATVFPQMIERHPDIKIGDIAILYPAAWIGDAIVASAQNHGFGTIRADTNALFPRSSKLMRWLESCALWCCGGWRSGKPRFSQVLNDGRRIFSEVLVSEEERLAFQRTLTSFLWTNRDQHQLVNAWLHGLLNNNVSELLARCRTNSDEAATLSAFMQRTGQGGDSSFMTLGDFARDGEGGDRINLSTLHSAKGREFKIVILFAMDDGRIPRQNARPAEVREARRLFYVGFTRPKEELHIVYTGARASPFVVEVERRIRDEL